MSDAGIASDGPSPSSVTNSEAEIDADSKQTKADLIDTWHRLPAFVFRAALTVDGVLLLLYALAVAFMLKAPLLFFLFDLDAEGNPPSWWFGIQQLLVALVFLLLASRIFTSDQRLRPLRPLFLTAGIGFAIISLDEIGELHESVSRLIVNSVRIRGIERRLEKSFHIAHHLRGGGVWIPLYAIIGIVALALLVPYFIKAYQLWRHQVVTAAIGFVVFVASAAILQVVGYFFPVRTLAHRIYVFVEQGLKMGGVSIVLYGITQVLGIGAERLTLRIGGDPVPDPKNAR